MDANKKGFGASDDGSSSSSSSSGGGKKKKGKKSNRLQKTLLADDNSSNNEKHTTTNKPRTAAKPYVKNEQDQLLEALARQSSNTCIGRAVAEFADSSASNNDPFWELMPSLISSRFPNIPDQELTRIAGFVRHTLQLASANDQANEPIRPVDWIDDPYRPYDELHAYMPNLGPTKPFHDPKQLELCQQLEANYDIIHEEYRKLLDHMSEEQNNNNIKFQSVTSMNYESGWKTCVLFYNGHRIPQFPYHICPTTTRILESVPLAGRIAGFNRQQPNTGIPLHTDGNNMWLTCQMGIEIPDGENKAHIRVGPETRYWENGKCLLYDTTYEHETMNTSLDQERVVLHVDFFNTFALTKHEIDVMQYIYNLREEFMKAEGVAKVGAQIL